MYLKLLTNTKDNIKDNPIPVYINTDNITEIGVKKIGELVSDICSESKYSVYMRMTDGTMYVVYNKISSSIEAEAGLAQALALYMENLKKQATVDLDEEPRRLIWRVLRPANG